MVAIKKLDGDIHVTSQIGVDDLGGLAASGFGTIINNRPDGEAPGQPDSSAMKAEADRLGLAYHHIPVTGADVADAHVDALDDALRERPPGAVLAFCASGRRSTFVWAKRELRVRPAEEVAEQARQAGYDLSGFLGLEA